jgi:hypothetical protein
MLLIEPQRDDLGVGLEQCLLHCKRNGLVTIVDVLGECLGDAVLSIAIVDSVNVSGGDVVHKAVRKPIGHGLRWG